MNARRRSTFKAAGREVVLVGRPMQEAALKLWFAIDQGGMGPFVYRMAPPDQL